MQVESIECIIVICEPPKGAPLKFCLGTHIFIDWLARLGILHIGSRVFQEVNWDVGINVVNLDRSNVAEADRNIELLLCHSVIGCVEDQVPIVLTVWNSNVCMLKGRLEQKEQVD